MAGPDAVDRSADYILRYSPDFPLAVVGAKSRYNHPAEGLQQAKEYAEILGLKFAAEDAAFLQDLPLLHGVGLALQMLEGLRQELGNAAGGSSTVSLSCGSVTSTMKRTTGRGV